MQCGEIASGRCKGTCEEEHIASGRSKGPYEEEHIASGRCKGPYEEEDITSGTKGAVKFAEMHAAGVHFRKFLKLLQALVRCQPASGAQPCNGRLSRINIIANLYCADSKSF